MNRRRIGIVVVIAALLGAAAFAWTSCRGGNNGANKSAKTGTGTTGGTGADDRASKRIDVATVARGSIEGTVTDQDGAPVPAARVCGYLYSDDLSEDETRDPFCATSGADGRYRLADLLPGNFGVHAHAPRFVPGMYKTKNAAGRDDSRLRLAAGESRQGIDIELRNGGVEVNGIVKDIGGGPVGGAWVYLRAGQQWDSRGGIATVQSGADGTFRAWTAPGRIHASAEADGYASGEKDAIAPGQTIEILLTPESVLAGRVVDKDGGAPVPGARVQAGGSWYDGDGTGWGSAMTDDDGRFRITRLSPGRYKPSASAPGRRGQAIESVLLGLGQTVEGIVIEVHPASRLSGKVVLDDGKAPCTEGWVSLRDDDAGGGDSTSIEEDGSVEIEALFPGTYKVDLTCTGYRADKDYPEVVVVAGADPEDQVWKVSSGARLRGTVFAHDGKPVAEASVSVKPVVSDEAWSGWESATTKDDGTFAIEGLRAGAYNVTASPVDQPANDKPVPVEVPETGEASVEIRLEQGGAVAGRVRDEDGVAVARVHVRAQGKMWSWNSNDGTQTLDDGSFRIDGLKAGSHRVTASRDQWGGAALRAAGKTDDDLQGEKIEVRPGQTTNVELVVESQSAAIRGRVVDGSGAPITDAFVDAERESDSAAADESSARRSMRWGWSRRPALTDTDGNFTVEGLSKGKYTVRAYRKGGGEALAEHVASGSSVTVTIRAPGSIAGQVAKEGGGAPERMTINVREPKTGFRRREDFFRSDGAFVMRDLPGGDYEVSVSSGEGTGTTNVTLADGQDLRGVTITLASRAGVTGRLVTADEGKPLAGYMIMVSAVGAMDSMSFEYGAGPPVSDADGKFEVKNAPAGRVQVMAYPVDMQDTQYLFARKIVTLEGGKTLDVGELKVQKMRAKMGDEPGDLGFDLKESPPGADPEKEKLIVAIVRPDGPAAKAGMKVDDQIVSVDGQDVRGDLYLYWQLAFVTPGTTVTFGLERGATVTITAGPPRT